MGYTYSVETRGGVEFHVLANADTAERVEIIPALGGTVSAIALRSGAEPVDLLFFDQPAEILENPLFRGRFLFPFNDRIPLGQYGFEGATHQLPINSPHDGASIHGFLHRIPMQIKRVFAGADSASLTLGAQIAADQFPGYPFDICLDIGFTLSTDGVTVDFNIVNTGASPCPFALGWHPYFRMDGSDVLRADYARYVEVDAELLPTRRLRPVYGTELDFSSGAALRGRSLDMGFDAPATGVTILERDGFAVEIAQDVSLFSYTQLYIPDDGASIAIEPITAATNSFNFSELGLRVLAPSERTAGSVHVRVRSLS